MYDGVLLYGYDIHVSYSYSSFIEHDDYDVLSEDSDTHENFRFRKKNYDCRIINLYFVD